MEFNRVIGKIDPQILDKVLKKISPIMLELAANPTFKLGITKMGGDPLLFALLYPVEHIATTAIPTAATNGKSFYWNPYFLLSLSAIGIRLVFFHEAFHCALLHPSRMGHRNKRLWNIAVDFVVNGMLMQDLKYRGFDPTTYFKVHLGPFLTLPQTIAMYQDPIAFAKTMNWDLKKVASAKDKVKNQNTSLNPEDNPSNYTTDLQQLHFYADPYLSDMELIPERIYEKLLKALPQCQKCGQLGQYHMPTGGEGQCSGCGADDYFDMFGMGDTLDDHIEVSETAETIAKRMSDGINMAKQLAGHIPAGLETTIGTLTAPQIKWQDQIIAQLHRSRNANNKTDWSRFKTRPLSFGLLLPKRRGNMAKFVCLLDTSGSMSKDDKAYVLSQLQSLDQRSEGVVIPFDCEPYYKDATTLTRLRMDDLLKVKTTGGGGTNIPSLTEVIKKFPCDFLLIATDAQLSSQQVLVDPKVPVSWIVVNSLDFKPPFGKVYNLHN